VDEDRFERGVAALQSLHDPVRRGLYRRAAVQHDSTTTASW